VPLLRSSLAVAAGYLLGTAPSADVAAKLTRVGLRTAGTGNPGAANVVVVLGRRWGAAVAAVDIAKGWAAGALGQQVGPGTAHAAATAAVLGHAFPPWSGFRGGKGVATSYGAVLAVFPVYAVPDVAVASLAARRLRDPRRATEISSVLWTAAATLWWRRRLPNLWGPEPTWTLPLHAAATSALLSWTLRRPAAVAGGARFGQPTGTNTAPTVPRPVCTAIDGPTT
jgi:acyl phosphate:glycerol-3-phosphate acyltransferase